jgi:hypothetical protein
VPASVAVFNYPPVDDAMTRAEYFARQSRQEATVEPPAAPIAEASPAPATTNGATRPCSECGGPLPPDARAERKTCSSSCARDRDIRTKRGQRRAEASPAALTPTSGRQVRPVAPGGDGAGAPDLLGALVKLASGLPVGWSVTLANDSASVHWTPGA